MLAGTYVSLVAVFLPNASDEENSYDSHGLRSSKTINRQKTDYMIKKVIVHQNRTPYYYQYNLQGDVTGIYDANGQLVTKQGKVPSWSTVKSRYWKNEAYLNSQNYSLSNLELMKKGGAP